MKLLLDTHTLLWYYLDDPQLSSIARGLIEDPANEKLVSPVSHWEVAIKLGTGKFSLTVPFGEFVKEAIFDNGFTILPIEPHHTENVITLSPHHKDPFDRLLIAQAIAENIPIVSADLAFDAYPITRLW